ncbi:MAG: acyltransferase domain-containing protein [Acidobacteriota bacterium]|nr:acyltransferase domain-containing protein [Acidobacteriota bacterium]
MDNGDALETLNDIAMIGMAGRFPGARDVDEFWRNLRDGVHSVKFFSDEELERAGIDRSVWGRPDYVKAGGVLEDIDLFDAEFFGFTPREAEIMDPQQRVFLECAWQALEGAGYDSETYEGRIGLYAGGGMNDYLLNIYSNRRVLDTTDIFQIIIGNEKDHLATQVSYRMNLRGPSIAVQTTCSTSLVAVSMACQSLLTYQCDMALAGGVSIKSSQRGGYLYREGGVDSPDGFCRAFDARAKGTVAGNGAGVVILKRLGDALADGDEIHAVIKGSAVNNDGSRKAGYTAPGVEGQAEVIAEALALARVKAETVSYVETHGTGTSLGDPIELAALTQAFRGETGKKAFCAVGSVKTNVGHLNTAAGVAGLIKTVQALKHGQLPPSLHFERPNPQIDFAASPFFVNTRLAAWETDGLPRRAGVSSFGIGGTNAHVVLEEAPPRRASGEGRASQLLLLSARTDSALEAATQNLADYLRRHPDANLADVAYTLQVGRRVFNRRRALVCQGVDDALEALSNPGAGRVSTTHEGRRERPVAMIFSGQGTQYVNMARELYETEATFREHVDLCAEILLPHLGLDLRDVLYPAGERAGTDWSGLEQTALAQPALFAVEYALARLWMEWGVRPAAMLGHSVGEYVAACLAGVFSLEDALALVALRGRLMQQLPRGAMLALKCAAQEEVLPLLSADERLSLAALNSPTACVVSGPVEAVEQLEARCAELNITARRLRTSHAFHSAMMDPMLAEFTEHVRRVRLRAPQVPYVSNVTGTWITAEEATSPDYWARHLRQTVRFAEGVAALAKMPGVVLLEAGPGHSLDASAVAAPAASKRPPVVYSLPHTHDRRTGGSFLLNALGRLWSAGVQADWSGVYRHERRRRLTLPTYPFERRRYWVDAVPQARADAAAPTSDGTADAAAASGLTPAAADAEDSADKQLEQMITQIWHEVLGVEQIGAHDNFFDLGGNSLMGIQLLSRLRKTFLLDLPMSGLFESPTVAGLAALIEQYQLEGEELDELERMLQEVEGLSAEDLAGVLASDDEQAVVN